MKRLGAIAILLALSALTGCKSSCEQLADEICNCQPTQQLRDSCNSQESAQAGQVDASPDQEATCQSLLGKCACYEDDTAHGKVDCGLARPAGP